MDLKGIFAFVMAATAAIGTALAHLACIFIGPACYKAQLAPPQIVQSAVDNTLLAPVATVFVSSLFIMCGLFAFSGAGFIRRLPFQNLALVVISCICILRGLATIPSAIFFPAFVSSFSITAGVVWFVTGICFGYGYICARRVNT